MNRKIFFLFSLLIFLTACNGQPVRGKKASSDWSRALPLEGMPAGGMDATLNQGVMNIVWPEKMDGHTQVRFTRLEIATQTLTSHFLNLGDAALRYVRLLPRAADGFLLLWSSRQPGTSPWGLQAASLDAEGTLDGTPVALVPPAAGVTNFDAALLPSGELFLVWKQSAPVGLYVARRQPEENTPLQVDLISEEGDKPTLQVGEDGQIFLAWQENDRLLFAMLATENSPPPHPMGSCPSTSRDGGERFSSRTWADRRLGLHSVVSVESFRIGSRHRAHRIPFLPANCSCCCSCATSQYLPGRRAALPSGDIVAGHYATGPADQPSL